MLSLLKLTGLPLLSQTTEKIDNNVKGRPLRPALYALKSTMFSKKIEECTKVEPAHTRKETFIRHPLVIMVESELREIKNFPPGAVGTEAIISVFWTVENPIVQQTYLLHYLPTDDLTCADDVFHLKRFLALHGNVIKLRLVEPHQLWTGANRTKDIQNFVP